jgi:transposase
VNLDERVPRSHPLRKRRLLVDGVLASLDAPFDARYARDGRPSIPPEQWLRAAFIQILDTVRAERQLVEQLDCTRLFRWFVGLGMDEGVRDHPTFSKNRDRLSAEGMTRHVFEPVDWQDLARSCRRHADRGVGLAHERPSHG